MIEKTVKVKLSEGLESRMAAQFVQVACQYKSEIHVNMDDKTVNAKSIMGMMMLGMVENENVHLIVDGADETAAVEELTKFLSGEL